MYFLGKHLLIAVYAVTLCITMRYYLRLLEQNSWDRRNYFALLGRENLRWLPLLFILIPSAALFLGYQALGMGLMLVYLLGIQLLFGRKAKEERKRDSKKLWCLFGLWGILWALLLLACFGIPKTQLRVVHLICGTAFLVQPFAAPLLARLGAPAEQRLGSRYIRGAGDVLKRHRGLQILLISGSMDQNEMGRILQALLSGKYRSIVAKQAFRTALDAAKFIRDIPDPGLEILICPVEAENQEELEAIVQTLHPEIAVQTSVDFVSLSGEADPAGEHGIRLVNGDDEALRQCGFPDKVLTFGLQESCDIHGRTSSVGSEGTRFVVSDAESRETEYLTMLLGEKQLRLLVGAIGVAGLLGMSEEEIRYRMAAVLPSPHHMQLVPVANAMLIDDSENTDPDQAEDALRTLEQFEGEKVLITSGFTRLGEIQQTANHRIGKLAAEVCDRILLMGEEIPYGIRAGILDSGYQPEHLWEAKDKEEARSLVGSWPSAEKRILLVEQVSDKPASAGAVPADMEATSDK